MPERQLHRHPQSRVPTNPRRKVPLEQRKRVAKACNDCNVRRIKCSGDRPCLQCASNSRECVYPAIVDKVSVPRTELEELRRKVEMYEKMLPDALLESQKLQSILHNNTHPPIESPPLSVSTARLSLAADGESPDGVRIKSEPGEDLSVAAPARLFQDSDGIGRHRGETSGAAFLDHLKELMTAAIPLVDGDQPAHPNVDFLSSLQTHSVYDSPSLSEFSVNPFWLPSNEIISASMSELRYLVQDGAGDWLCGGQYWFGDLETLPVRPPLSMMPTGDVTNFRYLSFYNVVLALSCNGAKCSPNSAALDSELTASEPYYARAAILLGNPLNVKGRTMGDVATLGVMCIYLIEIGAQDAAYMCITAGIQISVVLGAHRGWVDERGKRIFWSTYVMERWLSCLMGRPPSISDDDIQLPLPVDAPSMPPAAGLRANVEISRISTHVVSSTHHRSKSELDTREPANTMHKIDVWRTNLPPVLQLSADGVSNDMACCLLHMRSNQLLIIAIRPHFYAAIEAILAHRRVGSSPPPEPNSQLAHLVHIFQVGRRNLKIARHAVNIFSRHKWFHALPHFIFNAAICIVLGSLVLQQELSAEELEAGRRDVDFAVQWMTEGEALWREDINNRPTTSDILKEVRTLVDKLTTPILPVYSALETVPPFMPQVQHPAMMQNMSQFPMPVGENVMLYDELVTWMGDNWPICNSAYMGE